MLCRRSSYEPVLVSDGAVSVSASVPVEASVKIVFVRIYASFSANISASFTLISSPRGNAIAAVCSRHTGIFERFRWLRSSTEDSDG